MNADLERLCRAAADGLASVGQRPDSLSERELEAVVRAVLASIRDASESGDGPRYASGEWSRRNIEAFVDDTLGV